MTPLTNCEINSSMANNISNLNIKFLNFYKQHCKSKHRLPKVINYEVLSMQQVCFSQLSKMAISNGCIYIVH